MYIFLIIVINYGVVKGAKFSSKELYSDFTLSGDDLEKMLPKFPKFYLSEAEKNGFRNSFGRMHADSRHFMKYISNIQNGPRPSTTSPEFLAQIDEMLTKFLELQKNSIEDLVCLYEFYKCCNFFLYILKFLVQKEQELVNEFLTSVEKNMMHFIKFIVSLSEYCHNLLFKQQSLVEKFSRKSTNVPEHIRLMIMRNFCTKYITNCEGKFVAISYEKLEQMRTNYSLDDFLTFLLNIYVRFFVMKKISILYPWPSSFFHSKYPFSWCLKLFLHYNGRLTLHVNSIRSSLNKFLVQYELHFNEELIKYEHDTISFDGINKHGNMVNLDSIVMKTQAYIERQAKLRTNRNKIFA